VLSADSIVPSESNRMLMGFLAGRRNCQIFVGHNDVQFAQLVCDARVQNELSDEVQVRYALWLVRSVQGL
jgi:hypothetical protein